MTGETGSAGVAITTTADPHRMTFLETCARQWWTALAGLGLPTTVFVTVDGDDAAYQRAVKACFGFAEVIRIGQPLVPDEWQIRDGRIGVAANKNTGLEALYDRGVYDMFLSDDDTWPLGAEALMLHTEFGYSHSLVCWGKHRRSEVVWDPAQDVRYGEWTWPRGAMMYISRSCLETVGGMIEAFGPGGHEHVEWSRRIHQHGYTPAAFITPAEYNGLGSHREQAMGMNRFWHAEDAPRPGEPLGNLRARRRALTSIRRHPTDWPAIEAVMNARDGDTDFVSFRAMDNGRTPATMYAHHPRQGAEEK